MTVKLEGNIQKTIMRHMWRNKLDLATHLIRSWPRKSKRRKTNRRIAGRNLKGSFAARVPMNWIKLKRNGMRNIKKNASSSLGVQNMVRPSKPTIAWDV
jgi:hypothetical protein